MELRSELSSEVRSEQLGLFMVRKSARAQKSVGRQCCNAHAIYE